METRERNLIDLFAAARTEQPIVSFDRTRARVEAHEMPTTSATMRGSSNPTTTRPYLYRRAIMISALIGLAAAAVIAGFSIDGSGDITETAATPPAAYAPISPTTTPSHHPGEQPSSTPSSYSSYTSSPSHRNEPERPTPNDHDTPTDIAPLTPTLNTLTLDDEALARLGIQRDTAGAWAFFLSDGGERQMLGITMYGTIFDPQYGRRLKPTTTVTAIHPDYITDDEGKDRASIRDDDSPTLLAERELQEKMMAEIERAMSEGTASDGQLDSIRQEYYRIISSLSAEERSSGALVPILVRTGRVYTAADSAARRWRPDCIFWYRPTPEFLSLLPEKTKAAIERQLRLRALLQGKPGDLTVEEFIERQPVDVQEGYRALASDDAGDDAVAGLDLVGAIGAASGAITTSGITPNPARGTARLHFTLAAERRVAIDLYDTRGRLIRSLQESRAMTPSLHVHPIDLDGLDAGIYIVAITTGRESVQQRLVVAR